MYTYIHVCIYIYIERERVGKYTYLLCCDAAPQASLGRRLPFGSKTV